MENRQGEPVPAFQDTQSGTVYLSRFSDGRLAPIHVLDGLPEEVILERTPIYGEKIRPSVTAGFVREGEFYMREQAMRALSRRSLNQPTGNPGSGLGVYSGPGLHLN